MNNREMVIMKLLELEGGSKHHFYFTGKSIPVLETYGLKLIEEIEKVSKVTFKGIVKHFSMVMPYFDDNQGCEKFICDLKESVNIAKDCYDEYTGFVLIEYDKKWTISGINKYISRVFDYMKTLESVRYVVLAPCIDKKDTDLYAAFSTVGVCAFVEIEEIDYKSYLNQACDLISEAGFSITDLVKEELCQVLEKRYDEIVDIEKFITQWLCQLHLNRQIVGNEGKEIVIEDVQLLAGFTPSKKVNHTIGFGTGTGR